MSYSGMSSFILTTSNSIASSCSTALSIPFQLLACIVFPDESIHSIDRSPSRLPEDDDSAPSTSFTLALVLLIMVGVITLNERTNHVPSRALRILLFVLVIVLLLFYVGGVHHTLGELYQLVFDPESLSHNVALRYHSPTSTATPNAPSGGGVESTRPPRPSLRTTRGIALFCHDLQIIASRSALQVCLLLAVLYLLLQTFCIPGTVILNAAFGAVTGTLIALPVCTLLGTLGASSCYLLSRAVGVSLVEGTDRKLMKGKGVPRIRQQVSKFKSDLFVYLLFLRLTPILPNWLVNLASPVVGVPLRTFALATAVGIVPQTYLTVRFGSLASTAAAYSSAKAAAQQTKNPGVDASGSEQMSIVTVWDTLLLAVIGVAVLAGVRLKKKFAAQHDHHSDAGNELILETEEEYQRKHRPQLRSAVGDSIFGVRRGFTIPFESNAAEDKNDKNDSNRFV